MSYETLGDGALNYFPCRYGTSRLMFRGPRKKLETPYAAFVGGTETYGKFVAAPFPALLEEQTGISCLNLGCVNAGLDVFLNDTEVLQLCRKARVTVIQLTGAQNNSNRFYSVHARRNDRFLKASDLMATVFRDVDFTEINFTRHLLSELRAQSPDRYGMVVDELKSAWVARMKSFLKDVSGKTILLWMADHGPDDVHPGEEPGSDPLLVDRAMVEEIRPFATELVEVTVDAATMAEGTSGLVFPPLEAPAAAGMMPVSAHAQAATALSAPLRQLFGKDPARNKTA